MSIVKEENPVLKNRITKQILSVVLLVAIAVGWHMPAFAVDESTGAAPSKYFSAKKVSPKTRQAALTYKVNVENYQGANRVRVWLPCPPSTSYQKISKIAVNGNYDLKRISRDKQTGNKIVYVEWKKPKEKPELTFSFRVKRSEIITKNFSTSEGQIPSSMKKYLKETALIKTSGDIKATAERVTKGKKTSLAKAEAIYDYIVENYQRDPNIIGCGRGDVCNLAITKKGKCADIHSVFVAMCRSVGVPARDIQGIRILPEKSGDITGAYHCRAEFYQPGYGWVTVDPSDVLKFMLKEKLTLNDAKVQQKRDYFFGAQNENFIDISRGRDVRLIPARTKGKLNYFVYPFAEVDGKALDYLSQKNLKYKVTFQEL
ncbi:MAG: transglutaminase domain-containing protein [Candidatus Aquicultor sp.]|nr:transglutaminase domain-containing protein [Candidatus Aquicultor sp.]